MSAFPAGLEQLTRTRKSVGTDGYINTQLKNAYSAAEQSKLPFKLFLSFDYAASSWDPTTIINTIKTYAGHPAQYKYKTKPLVSTFEGPSEAPTWAAIKQETGCFFVPDYSSLGPQAAASTPCVDGLLSWEAWPDGCTADTPTGDSAYITALGEKPYMMPVSPWFYTNLPSKSWVWKGDSLWHLRWQQVLKYQPEFVEILTWNDWGESSYIGPHPESPSALPEGAASYVTPTANHTAWLRDLPYYIDEYKAGKPTPSAPAGYGAAPSSSSSASPSFPSPQPGSPAALPLLSSSQNKGHITAWYRTSPGSVCPSVPCNQPGQSSRPSAAQCSADAVFFTVFPTIAGQLAPTVEVQIGGMKKTMEATAPGVFHGSVPFSGATGPVTVSAGGMIMRGEPITMQCTNGWNAFVGSSQ